MSPRPQEYPQYPSSSSRPQVYYKQSGMWVNQAESGETSGEAFGHGSPGQSSPGTMLGDPIYNEQHPSAWQQQVTLQSTATGSVQHLYSQPITLAAYDPPSFETTGDFQNSGLYPRQTSDRDWYHATEQHDGYQPFPSDASVYYGSDEPTLSTSRSDTQHEHQPFPSAGQGYSSVEDAQLKNPAEDDQPTTSCLKCSKTFSGEYARGNLLRHTKATHSDNILFCEVKGCPKLYHRSDARLQHYRRRHPELNR